MHDPCPDCRVPTSNAPYICDECKAKHRAALKENVDRALKIAEVRASIRQRQNTA